MSLLSIVTVSSTTRDLPDVAVRRPARDVTESELRHPWFFTFVGDMFETLYATQGGIGLAATQVGVLLRVTVVALRDGTAPLVLVNPTYEPVGDALEVLDERCLSVPDFAGAVGRFAEIRARYLDYRGRPCDASATGLLARVMQHEIDHLDGTLYVDRIPDKSGIRSESGGFPARQAQQTMDDLLTMESNVSSG